MTLSDWRNAANGIVLISNPYNQNDVERGCCIVEKLRHNGFHPWKSNKRIIVTWCVHVTTIQINAKIVWYILIIPKLDVNCNKFFEIVQTKFV